MSSPGVASGTPNRADQLRREVIERNVAAILNAAVAQLERDPKPSMAGVARAAGVSRPTLYAHYPTREDLVEATVRRALQEARQQIAAANVDEGPAAEALRRLITAGWRVLARNLTIARLATEVLPPERMRQAHQAALDPVRRLITRGQGAGEFRADQPVDWMVTVLYTLMHAAAEDVSAGRRDAETAAVLIHGSIRGAFAPR